MSVYQVLGLTDLIGTDFLFVPLNMWVTPVFYLTVILTAVIALYRDFIWKYIHRMYFPKPYHYVQEIDQDLSNSHDVSSNL